MNDVFYNDLKDAITSAVHMILTCIYGPAERKKTVRKANSGPRKSRSDIGSMRNVGDKKTVFYTPEIVQILGLKSHKHVWGKIKSFNAMGEGVIRMPGRPYKNGYRASKDTWNKFFRMYK